MNLFDEENIYTLKLIIESALDEYAAFLLTKHKPLTKEQIIERTIKKIERCITTT